MGQAGRPCRTIALQFHTKDGCRWTLIVGHKVGGQLSFQILNGGLRVGGKKVIIDVNQHHDANAAALVQVDRVIAIRTFKTYINQDGVKVQSPYARPLFDAIKPL